MSKCENVAMINSETVSIILGKRPLIIRGLNLGPCVSSWSNVAYVKDRIPANKRVTVHVCRHGGMDFLTKNFQYKTLEFSELLDRCSSGEKLKEYFLCDEEKYYLRALGEDPRKEAAFFEKHFPALASDIEWPNIFPRDKLFSSVLRVSSAAVRLWTHYDIMDNILMQIVGRKTVILFDPVDAPYLYLNGDKSEVMDVENPDLSRYPLFARANRFRADLVPGDVLYIPALWFHHVTSTDFSIAVNAFFRSDDVRDDWYDGKDVYGNSDLLPAQRAFQGLQKAMNNIDVLPEPYRRFYAYRCMEMLRKRFLSDDTVCGDVLK